MAYGSIGTGMFFLNVGWCLPCFVGIFALIKIAISRAGQLSSLLGTVLWFGAQMAIGYNFIGYLSMQLMVSGCSHELYIQEMSNRIICRRVREI